MTPPQPTMKQQPAPPSSPKPTQTPTRSNIRQGMGGLSPVVSVIPAVPVASPSNGTVSSSRDRLQQLMSVGGTSNSDFDKIVKERIKNRKEKDDYSIAKLKVQITQLEHALEAEIKRRIASHQQLEQNSRQEIELVAERLSALVTEKAELCTARLEALEGRVEDLSQLLHQDLLVHVPQQLAQQSNEISQKLDTVSKEFQSEKKELLAREGRILKQVLDYERSLTEQIEHDRTSTERRLAELKQRLESQKQAKEDSDNHFATTMQQQLSQLQKQLEREKREREVEDDAIVDAMNRYTTKLQTTLNAITSED